MCVITSINTTCEGIWSAFKVFKAIFMKQVVQLLFMDTALWLVTGSPRQPIRRFGATFKQSTGLCWWKAWKDYTICEWMKLERKTNFLLILYVLISLCEHKNRVDYLEGFRTGFVWILSVIYGKLKFKSPLVSHAPLTTNWPHCMYTGHLWKERHC